jgi:hypothetical protein
MLQQIHQRRDDVGEEHRQHQNEHDPSEPVGDPDPGAHRGDNQQVAEDGSALRRRRGTHSQPMYEEARAAAVCRIAQRQQPTRAFKQEIRRSRAGPA